MTSESQPIRVKPLSTTLRGADPVAHILSLTESGRWGFYVCVPDGFRCDFKELRLLTNSRVIEGGQEGFCLIRKSPDPSYLQLDKRQIQELLVKHSLTLHWFEANALFLRLRSDGLPSIDFDHQRIRAGKLEPKSSAIADATPTKFDAAAGDSAVVKSPIQNSNMFSYSMHGVGFKDIFVEANADDGAIAVVGSSLNSNFSSANAHLPADPFGLEKSSPLVFSILVQAYKNRDAARREIDAKSVAITLKGVHPNYPKNPKPFNDKRDLFGANLANPHYKYKKDNTRPGAPLPINATVPSDAFFNQKFINSGFSKVLYAACRWNGTMEPKIGSSESLVDLLVDFGFWDAGENDQVQSLLFFITGEMCERDKNKNDFRHERAEVVRVNSSKKKGR